MNKNKIEAQRKKKNGEIAILLRTAAEKIISLRMSNRAMGEKLELVEGLLSLRHVRIPSGEGSPDIVPELRMEANSLKPSP